MSKRILAAAATAVALALTACGGAEQNNVAIENVEDLNATEDLNMDMNTTDTNAGDVGNDTADNTTNSY
jgi:hypothetical protein